MDKEWMKQSSGTEGCYAAVGSIDHSIQLWNLEEADPLEPAQVLGVLVNCGDGDWFGEFLGMGKIEGLLWFFVILTVWSPHFFHLEKGIYEGL